MDGNLSMLESNFEEISTMYEVMKNGMKNDIGIRIKKACQNSKILMTKILKIQKSIEKRAVQTKSAIFDGRKILAAEKEIKNMMNDCDEVKDQLEQIAHLADEAQFNFLKMEKTGFKFNKGEIEPSKKKVPVKELLQIMSTFEKSLAEAQEDILEAQNEMNLIKK